MVGSSDDVTLTSSLRSQLLAMQKTSKDLALNQTRLATGKKVTSAIGNANNFFAAQSLNTTAEINARLIDGLRQNVQAIKTAQIGLESILTLLEIAESLALEAATAASALPVSTTPLNQQILADNPAGYWQLAEGAGGAATNQGGTAGIIGTYTGGPSLGQAPLYDGGGTSVSLNGVNQFIAIPDSAAINLSPVPLRTVELVFNADTTAGRQVLYEEGGEINSMGMYIDNGRIHFNARNGTGVTWGPFNISAPINAGETYHIAMQLDAPNGEFRGYLNGSLVGTGVVTAPMVAHSGDIGIGAMRANYWFHDGAQIGQGYYYNGSISDVALYNQIISEAGIESRAASIISQPDTNLDDVINEILHQIDLIVASTHYRGINLLDGDLMTSVFNATRTSTLETQGQDMTSTGLGITAADFSTSTNIQTTLAELGAAIDAVRNFSGTLANSYNIIQTRDSFTENMVNTNREGADKLVLADMNEEGATMTALQVRQQTQVSVLSLSGKSSIADLLRDLSL